MPVLFLLLWAMSAVFRRNEEAFHHVLRMFKGSHIAVTFPVEKYIVRFRRPAATVSCPFRIAEKEAFAGFPIGDNVSRIVPIGT